jgi:hypothetical protein
VTVSWTKYIPHDQREAYERAGWIVKDSLGGTHHGKHSLLGEWKGEGRPPNPELLALTAAYVAVINRKTSAPADTTAAERSARAASHQAGAAR